MNPGAELSPKTKTRIETMLKENPIFLFMKGTPHAPMCGFSARAVAILNELNAKFGTFDVLSDNEIREGIKAFGQWPTIPQLYIKGKLVGGSDIMMEMYETGELKQLLSDILT
jgi:monothiol glutaredoxin